MRITLFGAAGNVGRRVIAEALSRGHQVTAVSRHPERAQGLPAGIAIRRGDAANPDDVATLSAGEDLVIAATRPAPGAEEELVAATKGLLAGLRSSGARLLLVGGAGSLTVPGMDGVTLVETPDFPSEIRPIALAGCAQLAACQADEQVDWSYLSPPASLEPGERTGEYRRGGDELLTDEVGVSAISMEDFAVALLDEAEQPQHHRRRFTVAY